MHILPPLLCLTPTPFPLLSLSLLSLSPACRDIKPENILLVHPDPRRGGHVPLSSSEDSGSGLVNVTSSSRAPLSFKLSDFGLSQLIAPGEKLVKACGTWAYSAWEMLDPSRPGYDTKFDVYSFGLVFFIALAGYHPCDPSGTSSITEIKARARAAAYDFNQPEWDTISAAAKDLCAKTIVRDPAARLDSTALLAHPWFAGATEVGEGAGAAAAAAKGTQPVVVTAGGLLGALVDRVRVIAPGEEAAAGGRRQPRPHTVALTPDYSAFHHTAKGRPRSVVLQKTGLVAAKEDIGMSLAAAAAGTPRNGAGVGSGYTPAPAALPPPPQRPPTLPLMQGGVPGGHVINVTSGSSSSVSSAVSLAAGVSGTPVSSLPLPAGRLGIASPSPLAAATAANARMSSRRHFHLSALQLSSYNGSQPSPSCGYDVVRHTTPLPPPVLPASGSGSRPLSLGTAAVHAVKADSSSDGSSGGGAQAAAPSQRPAAPVGNVLKTAQ